MLKNYEVEYVYSVPVFGTVIVEAEDVEEATDLAKDYVYDTFADAEEVSIETIKEIVH